MSYSQYRQRSESGKTLPLGTSLSMSSKKEAPFSEDEQSTQEGTFTGYQSRSNYQPLSSMKRSSKMGRLKTAPLPIRLATIDFDEGQEDNIDDSDIEQKDTDNPSKPASSAEISNTSRTSMSRNQSCKNSALSVVASFQESQNYPRKMSKLLPQRREPLSHRENICVTGAKHETQPSKPSVHLGKSPVKARAVRDIENLYKNNPTKFARSPEKKFPPPVRSPTKHTSGLKRQHYMRQHLTNHDVPNSESKNVPSFESQCITGTSDYVTSSSYSCSISQMKASPEYSATSDEQSVSIAVPESSNIQQITTTDLHRGSSIKERSNFEKDTTDARSGNSAISVERTNTDANSSISRVPRDILTVRDKSYTILNKIGKGGSSVVYRALDESNQTRAIKKVDLSEIDPKQAEDFKNEISHLERMKGKERIIEIFGWEQKKYIDGEYLFVVMECGEKDLGTLLKELSANNKGLTDNKIKFYWEEMLEAVLVIHREGIVHRDLKPGNFVIVGGRIKLIDFGIAKAVAEDKTSITCDNMMGTFNFMSPEVIESKTNDSGVNVVKFNQKADVWSLGCILYNMIYKKMPFGHIREPFAKISAIINPKHEIKMNENELGSHDPIVNDVLRLCLVRDPSKRCSIEDLLVHKYLKSQHTDTPNKPLPKHKSMEKMLMEYQNFSPRSKEAFTKALLGNSK